MSRCFPYPPPGYTLSRGSNEALIESIKIQKEREKAKGEKRTGKDEKKKSKKEKAKPKATESDLCGGKDNSKGSILHKEIKDDTEQLERSNITEEHELAQNASCSSDSTQNSNKRKRHAADGTHAQAASPASNGACVQDASPRSRGNIVRIRLSSQKNTINKERQLPSPSISIGEGPVKMASRAEQNVTFSSSVAIPSTTIPFQKNMINKEQQQLRSGERPVKMASKAEQNVTCSSSVAIPSTTIPSQKNMINKERQLPSPSIRSWERPVKMASRAEQNATPSTMMLSQKSAINKEQQLPSPSMRSWERPVKMASRAGQNATPSTMIPSQKSAINKDQQLPSPSIRIGERPMKMASKAQQNVTCSSSAATPSTTSQALPPVLRSNPPRPLNNGLKRSQIPSSSREDKPTSSAHHHVSKESRKRQKLLHKYTQVLENFLPPLQSSDTYDDDQDWLLGLKKEHEPMQLDKTSSTVDSQMPCYSSCSMWPAARHLPDTDIYALPYTIPF